MLMVSTYKTITSWKQSSSTNVIDKTISKNASYVSPLKGHLV